MILVWKLPLGQETSERLLVSNSTQNISVYFLCSLLLFAHPCSQGTNFHPSATLCGARPQGDGALRSLGEEDLGSQVAQKQIVQGGQEDRGPAMVSMV